MISYLSHNFLTRLKNSIILCLSKYNVLKNFETNMSIMYLIAKNVAIEEKKIEIVIFENSTNENIFKLSDFEMIIISMKIV